MIHLDTSFLIRATRGDLDVAIRLENFRSRGERIAVSSVAWAEFLCGPLTHHEMALALQMVGQPLDFTPEHAAFAARLFNASGRRRRTMVDCMIGAVAILEGAPLATANYDDFTRFVRLGLRLA